MPLSAARRAVGGDLAGSGRELDGFLSGAVLVDGTSAIRGCSVDSRSITKGQIFLALPGERTHGLRFASEALHSGAAAVVVEGGDVSAELRQIMGEVELVARDTGASLIRVENGRAALRRAAKGWRDRFAIDVIGVTGSVGKTTTKQLIAAALGGDVAGCAATPGNANNEIGLPISLLNLPDGTTRYVAEMGMYIEGDIRALCTLARPRIGVVTAIDAVHAERAGGLDAIERGKGELVEALPPEGWAVLAADDPRVSRLAVRTPARIVTAGHAAAASVRIIDATLDEPSGHTHVTLQIRDETVRVDLPLFGLHFAKAAALAVAVADICEVAPSEAATRLAVVQLPPGRATVRMLSGIRVIDDAYNAAPTSMAAALATLAACRPRRFVALGPMGELGEYADEAHLAVGQLAAASGLELLIVFGAEADGIAEGARTGGMPIEKIMRLNGDLSGISAAAGLLGDMVAPGDTVLVKASRASELERLIDELAARWSEVAQ